MLDGQLSKLDKLDLRSTESGCSSWPTPTAGDAKGAGSRNAPNSKAHKGVSLTDAVQTGDSLGRMWPTPSASVANDGETPETWQARADKLKEKGINGNGAGTPLTVEAMKWSTPTARDWKDGSNPSMNVPTNALLGRQAPRVTGKVFHPGSGQQSEPIRLRLNPCFVAWLQGMPTPWWTLPNCSGPTD
tara:strand:- start:526 stop:1089 length:564 start_codon:yes stop_codon:yes gene_type:complete